MRKPHLTLCLAFGLCAGLSLAGTKEELRAANREAMRKAAKAEPAKARDIRAQPPVTAKAGAVKKDAPAFAAVLAEAAALTNGAAAVARCAGSAPAVANRPPAVRQLGLVAAVEAGGCLFSWREDRPLLFPELEARRPTADSYFGALERRIAAACATNDLDAAAGLARRYVHEWDNVYKVHPRQGRFPEPSADERNPP